MSEILFDNVVPADVTTYVRNLAARLDSTGINLAGFLPNRVIKGIESRTTRVSRTQTVARFRAFDAVTPIGRRPVAISASKVGLAPLGQKLPLKEQEILLKALGNGDYSEIIGMVYDDMTNNTAAIHNLMETLRAQFLFEGKVTADDNGFIQEADFGLPALHNLDAVAVGTLWSTAAWDSIEQELAWVQTVQTDADASVTAMITSRRVVNAMLKSDVYKTPVSNVVNRSLSAMNGLRTEAGLPPVFIYDKEIAGVRLTPDNKIALVTSTVGETQWGDTAEALKLFGSNAIDEQAMDSPAIAASAWISDDPVNVWSKANATALPVAGDINGLFVAEVLAA